METKANYKVWMGVFVAVTVLLVITAITIYMKYTALQKDITKVTTKTANPSPAVVSATVNNIQTQANAISSPASN